MMIVSGPQNSRPGRVSFTVHDQQGEENELWFEVSDQRAEALTDRIDCALVSLLMPAMARGEDLHAEGPATDSLIQKLDDEVQSLLISAMPTLSRVRVSADELQPPVVSGVHVATGFSAGVDSFTVIRDFHLEVAIPSERLTLLLFTNVGSHGEGGRRLFRERTDRVRVVAERLDLPLVTIDSNLEDYYRGFTYEATHVMRAAGAALVLQPILRKWLHASTYQWSQMSVSPDPYQSRIESLLLPLIGETGPIMRSAVSQYTRVEKAGVVSEIPVAFDSLDVCTGTSGFPNCGLCGKCSWTIFALELMGASDKFAKVFDMDAYARKRERLIARILIGTRPQDQELQQFARSNGFRPSLRIRMNTLAMRIQRSFREL